MWLIFFSDALSDRFYQALFRKLLHPDLLTTSKQPMFLHLLFKAMSRDESDVRVKVSSNYYNVFILLYVVIYEISFDSFRRLRSVFFKWRVTLSAAFLLRRSFSSHNSSKKSPTCWKHLHLSLFRAPLLMTSTMKVTRMSDILMQTMKRRDRRKKAKLNHSKVAGFIEVVKVMKSKFNNCRL